MYYCMKTLLSYNWDIKIGKMHKVFSTVIHSTNTDSTPTR